uniref:Uncharacterized protein n=1 Tax=Wuchereria bancrofti TaxID=6293 RepID=A0AAF5PHQ1_WUCBA
MGMMQVELAVRLPKFEVIECFGPEFRILWLEIKFASIFQEELLLSLIFGYVTSIFIYSALRSRVLRWKWVIMASNNASKNIQLLQPKVTR